MTTTAEIVTFRLLPGHDADTCAKAAADMDAFFADVGGMIRRALSVDANGLWTDHILWTSMQAAEHAAAQVMSPPDAAPFMTMIDPGSVQMRHATVHMQME